MWRQRRQRRVAAAEAAHRVAPREPRAHNLHTAVQISDRRGGGYAVYSMSAVSAGSCCPSRHAPLLQVAAVGMTSAPHTSKASRFKVTGGAGQWRPRPAQTLA